MRRGYAGRVPAYAPRRRLAAAALLLAGLASWPAQAGPSCRSDAWAVYGAVRTAGGAPVDDAEVFLLLDKIDARAYAREGVRGRRFRTNEFGKYQAGLICSDSSDRPNPCAKKLKHLTAVVSAPGYGMTLRVWKLADLNVVAEDGVCFVTMPEVRLERGP